MSDTKTEPETAREMEKQPAPSPHFAFGASGAGWRQGVWRQPTPSGNTEPPKAA